MDFEQYWTLIGGDANFANRKEAAKNAWDSHPDKQAAIIAWLRKHGAYRGRNPYFFIQDFRERQPYPTLPITPNTAQHWSATAGRWQIRQDRK